MSATAPAIHQSAVVKVVPMTVTLYVPILTCGHAGQCSSNQSTVGAIGDRRRCLICTQQGRKQ